MFSLHAARHSRCRRSTFGDAMRLIFLMFIAAYVTTVGLVQAQTFPVLKSVVRDSVTGLPVENVNVFLSSTTLGVGTDRAGRYMLRNVPPGRYSLICSRVGYALKAVSVDVGHIDTVISNVTLAPRLIMMGAVEVSSEAAREFQKNLERFATVFLGDGPNAHQCRITNPQVLNFLFDDQSGILIASADQPLLITNTALGYDLQVSMAEFRWDTHLDFGAYVIYPQFRSLPVAGERDSLERNANRARTYDGSFQHFLRALVTGNMESERFVVYKGDLEELQQGRGAYVPPDALQLEFQPGSWLKLWVFDGWLRVSRLGEGTYRASYITMDRSGALIDHFGVLDNPLAVQIIGRWSRERVADMLPLNEGQPSSP